MARPKKKDLKIIDPINIEKKAIALAYETAIEQMENGTAPASTVNYFLKIGGSREYIERDMLSKQTELLEVKANNIKNSEGEKQAYLDAIDAIKNYSYDKMS